MIFLRNVCTCLDHQYKWQKFDGPKTEPCETPFKISWIIGISIIPSDMYGLGKNKKLGCSLLGGGSVPRLTLCIIEIIFVPVIMVNFKYWISFTLSLDVCVRIFKIYLL